MKALLKSAYSEKILSSYVNLTRLVSIGFIATICTGCLGPRKIDKWVNAKYSSAPVSIPKKKADYLTVSSNFPAFEKGMSDTKSKTSNFLPLLFYWHWDYRNTCTLNPTIPV